MNRSILARLALTACASLVAAAGGAAWAAQPPFSFESMPGRLPKDVVPVDYTVAIEPDIEAATLAGKESVTLKFARSTATIAFNSLEMTLDHVKLDGTAVKSVVSDDKTQLTTVTLNAPAAAGNHTLAFGYAGKLQRRPEGLFLQPYVRPGGEQGLMLSTNLEPTGARRVFPCWDEPAFRARIQLTATIPAQWQAVGNMPAVKRVVQGKKATVSFERTPAMSTYLFEFSAGDLVRTSARSGATEVGVWVLRGDEPKAATALANAVRILADYDDYFGIAFPLPKLDAVGVPGGLNGAMESWGAITYTATALLVDDSSSITARQLVYSTQAHEMAHQWFGDLVTMGWWDDLWLNESFASWMAAKETDRRNPSWNWWEEQDEAREDALSGDAQAGAHAVYQPVEDELRAGTAADPRITYEKGQTVLRMLEAYLGEDAFRKGVRRYMKDRAFSNATSADLWKALSAAGGQEVAEVARGWIEQPGFPLVSVQAGCADDGARTVSLAQKRFFQRQDQSGSERWKVPLRVRAGSGAPRAVLLTGDGQELAAGRCGEPLSVNADGIGYYRSLYDDATMQANTKNLDALDDGDLIALLDDQWAFVEAGVRELPSYLALAGSMRVSQDVRAWEQITHALGEVERDERGLPGHDAFAAYERSVLHPALARIGTEGSPGESPDVQKLRRRLMTVVGSLGDPEVLDIMRKRFAGFLEDRNSVAPDDQGAMLAVVARNGDAQTFEQLHALARKAAGESETRRFYSGLCSVRDPKLAEEAARIAMSDEIPPQLTELRLELLGQIAADHPSLAWMMFTAGSDQLLAPYGTLAPLILAQFVPEGFWNAVPYEELAAWLEAKVPHEMAPVLANGLDAARFKIDEKARLVAAADSYLAGRAAARK